MECTCCSSHESTSIQKSGGLHLQQTCQSECLTAAKISEELNFIEDWFQVVYPYIADSEKIRGVVENVPVEERRVKAFEYWLSYYDKPSWEEVARGVEDCFPEWEDKAESLKNKYLPDVKFEHQLSQELPPLEELNSVSAFKETSDVRDWYALGWFLEIPEDLLTTIEEDHSRTDSRRQAVLDLWLKLNETTAGWQVLGKAIGNMRQHLGLSQRIRQRSQAMKESGGANVPQGLAEKVNEMKEYVSGIRVAINRLSVTEKGAQNVHNIQSALEELINDFDGLIAFSLPVEEKKEKSTSEQEDIKKLQGLIDLYKRRALNAEKELDELRANVSGLKHQLAVKQSDPVSAKTHEEAELDPRKEDEQLVMYKRIALNAMKELDEIKAKTHDFQSTPKESDIGGVKEDETELIEGERTTAAYSSDQAVQFDYLVPMEDLLHGATVIGETVFLLRGDSEQFYRWPGYGFNLYVPKGCLQPTETCFIAVKALIAGRFIFPENTELISGLYAISTARRLRKEVRMEIQHHLVIENKAQTRNLYFIKARPFIMPGLKYHFVVEKGGLFAPHSSFGSLWQSDFCITGMVSASDSMSLENLEVSANNEEASENFSNDGEGDECGGMEEKEPDENEGFIEDPRSENANADNANSQQSISFAPAPGLYRAHTFYEQTAEHNWRMDVIPVKHLDTHIKYIVDKFSHLDAGQHFKFRFKPADDPSILLETCVDENLPDGWQVHCHLTPCEVTKEEIDELGKQEDPANFPDIPKCIVSISADEKPACKSLHYHLLVEGTEKQRKILVSRNLLTSCVEGSSRKRSLEDKNSGNNQGVKKAKFEIESAADNPEYDLQAVKHIIKDVVDGNYADLSKVIETSREETAKEMLSAGFISRQKVKGASSDYIIDCFTAGLKFKKTIQKLEDYCEKFFRVLNNLGGPFIPAAQSVTTQIKEVLRDKLKLDINLNVE